MMPPAPEDGIEFPIWAWYQAHHANKKKPDMRHGAFYDVGQKEVYRVEFLAERSSVLLSDYHLWHFVLNRSIILEDEARLDQIENDYPDYYHHDRCEATQKAISDTWPKIFDLVSARNHPYGGGQEQAIQACVWAIPLKQVTDIQRFKNRNLLGATAMAIRNNPHDLTTRTYTSVGLFFHHAEPHPVLLVSKETSSDHGGSPYAYGFEYLIYRGRWIEIYQWRCDDQSDQDYYLAYDGLESHDDVDELNASFLQFHDLSMEEWIKGKEVYGDLDSETLEIIPGGIVEGFVWACWDPILYQAVIAALYED